jgi:hypothetical protein
LNLTEKKNSTRHCWNDHDSIAVLDRRFDAAGVTDVFIVDVNVDEIPQPVSIVV